MKMLPITTCKNWKYTEIPAVFNGKKGHTTYVVETAGQLKSVLDNVHQNDQLTTLLN
ncbi:hypothetical protein ABVN80_10270 [Acinetobacter baumannii]